MIAPIRRPLFSLGKVTATPAVLKAIHDSGEAPGDFLERHVHGDWGSVFDDERKRNDEAVLSGGPIASVFRTANGVKICVVTHPPSGPGECASTAMLLPSEG